MNDGNNNGQLRIATPPRVAHAKPPGPIILNYSLIFAHIFILSLNLSNQNTFNYLLLLTVQYCPHYTSKVFRAHKTQFMWGNKL